MPKGRTQSKALHYDESWGGSCCSEPPIYNPPDIHCPAMRWDSERLNYWEESCKHRLTHEIEESRQHCKRLRCIHYEEIYGPPQDTAPSLKTRLETIKQSFEEASSE